MKTVKKYRGNMTQEELAEKSGLPLRLVIAYDEDKICFDNACVRNVIKLAYALGRPLSSFMADPDTRVMALKYEEYIAQEVIERDIAAGKLKRI